MTKKEAVRIARDIMKMDPDFYRSDDVAKREVWNNLIDELEKDGEITQKQSYSWSNPF